MKKIIIMIAALLFGAFSSFAQSRSAKDSVFVDKSFEDAGNATPESHDYQLAPKFYKAGTGMIAPEQPIALSTAKKAAMDMARARPTPFRRDCLNIFYTTAPIYSQGNTGNIVGSLKGTVVVKWDTKRRMWVFSYLKYQLVNIDQNAQVFQYDVE